MQRHEAIRLLRNICKCIPDVLISCISLTPINLFKEDFVLRINMEFDHESFKHIESIVKKHGMNFKEEKGSLLIYEAEPIEIMA